MPVINLPHDWRNEPCTKLQREYIELRRIENRMKYFDLLQLCSKISGCIVKDIGELTKGDASLVLDELIDLCGGANA